MSILKKIGSLSLFIKAKGKMNKDVLDIPAASVISIAPTFKSG
ncbi:hypothetical protein BH09BAC1_BH09BAC1_26870 [soil metagenome]